MALAGDEEKAGVGSHAGAAEGPARAAPSGTHPGFPPVRTLRVAGGTGCGEKSHGFCPCLSAELATLVIKNIKSAFDFWGVALRFAVK